MAGKRSVPEIGKDEIYFQVHAPPEIIEKRILNLRGEYFKMGEGDKKNNIKLVDRLSVKIDETKIIKVKIYDSDPGSDDLIGSFSVAVTPRKSNKVEIKWSKLSFTTILNQFNPTVIMAMGSGSFYHLSAKISKIRELTDIEVEEPVWDIGNMNQWVKMKIKNAKSGKCLNISGDDNAIQQNCEDNDEQQFIIFPTQKQFSIPSDFGEGNASAFRIISKPTGKPLVADDGKVKQKTTFPKKQRWFIFKSTSDNYYIVSVDSSKFLGVLIGRESERMTSGRLVKLQKYDQNDPFQKWKITVDAISEIID